MDEIVFVDLAYPNSGDVPDPYIYIETKSGLEYWLSGKDAEMFIAFIERTATNADAYTFAKECPAQAPTWITSVWAPTETTVEKEEE
jgi:hypothetical protein